MKTDILIVGSGCSGLYCAINLPRDKRITVITKSDVESSDSYLAQGGICMLKDDSDYDDYFTDTLKAGHYKNDRESVDIMIRSSQQVIADLVKFGAEFARDDNGDFLYTREGAHSANRILFHEDVTGREITSHLYKEASALDNIEILEYTSMLDILCVGNTCTGAVVKTRDGDTVEICADYTVLATGGIGGIYRHSTNFRHLTGDALAVAIKHNVRLKDIDYIQIHPTTLYSPDEHHRSFLISESVRGEGAKLYGKDMKRFVNELLPRDMLTEAIYRRMRQDGMPYVWEDLRTIPRKELMSHFPNIVKHCASRGFDVTKECIPVVPAQHYFMGGIWVDHQSRTSMERLYAVGETACNGVHGQNRLASNSLLESLVFAKRAAGDIAEKYSRCMLCADFDKTEYADEQKLAAEYKTAVRDAIKNAENKRRSKKNMFDEVTLKLNVDPLIISALKEDITGEDVSSACVMQRAQTGEVDLICKEDGIICGLQIFERVFRLLDSSAQSEFYVRDGEEVKRGQLMGKIRADVRTLLSGERTALNYLQHMSGIATYTHEVASLLKGTNIKLLDTRKTTPNCRIFEKYAVRVGGGHNHRYNLSDGVMLKDNHINAAGGVTQAVVAAKEYAPFVRKIEVEVENLDMVKEAVEAGADIIMLDNMSDDDMRAAVKLIAGRAQTEASGNVTKENIARLSDIGVDYVSSGALTHSAPILDISMKNLRTV